MKKIISAIIWTSLFLVTGVYAYDNGDFQIWNTDVEEFKIGKNLKMALEEEFRWGDNAKEFYYQHYDAGFFYDIREWIGAGGGYRRIYDLKKGKFKIEDEPYAVVTLRGDFNGFRFDNRSRIEYRYFDYQNDSWRYRNKVTVRMPWKFTELKIYPYISDEIFVGFNGTGGLNQNRISSGLGMNLAASLKAEIYYMMQSTKSSKKWTDANILGAKFKIEF